MSGRATLEADQETRVNLRALAGLLGLPVKEALSVVIADRLRQEAERKIADYHGKANEHDTTPA